MASKPATVRTRRLPLRASQNAMHAPGCDAPRYAYTSVPPPAAPPPPGPLRYAQALLRRTAASSSCPGRSAAPGAAPRAASLVAGSPAEAAALLGECRTAGLVTGMSSCLACAPPCTYERTRSQGWGHA